MFLLKRKNIARFEKVSYEEFKRTILDLYFTDDYRIKKDCIFGVLIYPSAIDEFRLDDKVNKDDLEKFIKDAYDKIVIPEAKTIGSAGHDFTIPFDVAIRSIYGCKNTSELYNCSIIIPTGIRCCIDKGWVLEIYPRSGLGIKGLKIENTVPIIDQDYYYADNEGHILLKITNESKTKEPFKFIGGKDRIAQGLFKIYGTAGKPNKQKRTGGFNSTSEEGSILIKKRK